MATILALLTILTGPLHLHMHLEGGALNSIAVQGKKPLYVWSHAANRI